MFSIGSKLDMIIRNKLRIKIISLCVVYLYRGFSYLGLVASTKVKGQQPVALLSLTMTPNNFS